MKFALVTFESLLFFLNNLLELGLQHLVRSEVFLQQHNSIFRQGPDSKFPVQWMPNLTDNQRVQRNSQNVRDSSRDNYPASGQPKDDIYLDLLVP
jgi:hypothetical protein